MDDNQELLFFNGIDGVTGEYALPPMRSDELFEIIRDEQAVEDLHDLRRRYQATNSPHLGVLDGVDPRRLEQAGWGMIFAADDEHTATEEALDVLFNHRVEQAGGRFRLFSGSAGYHLGESVAGFLDRHGGGPGPADTDKVPYYLLIVGSPEQIPYAFQLGLGSQYAVGRIYFDDLESYRNYARSVVAAETGQVKLARQAALFGTANNDDRATAISTQYLMDPLQEQIRTEAKDWQFTSILREEASKSRFAELFGGDPAPAFLFSAAHGMAFPTSDSRRSAHQGALLCQDWPGPSGYSGPIPQEFYFAGDDLRSDANLLGMIAFFFASYGAGTLSNDGNSNSSRLAGAPFEAMAQLPMRMLSQPSGGALAVVGQVGQAWGYSAVQSDLEAQTEAYAQTVLQLLRGYPVGLALRGIKQRYAELAIMLSDQLEKLQFETPTQPGELIGLWTAWKELWSLVIYGDPFAGLPVVGVDETASARPTLQELQNRAAATGDAEPTDDLTKVRGIGEKTQDALYAAEIRTYARLARTDTERLSQIVRDQGIRTQLSQMATWPEQAAAFAQFEPARSLLFRDEQPGPQVYISQNDRQWHLAVDGLVLPVDSSGRPGGMFAQALFQNLNRTDRANLARQIVGSISSDFDHKNPVLIPLADTYAAQLLPNRPQGDDHKYFLIAATAGSAEKITDLREAAYAMVMKAASAGITKLAVIPVGSGSGAFKGQAKDVASQMIHGIWAARLDLESTQLSEITFAPIETEAVQAAEDKARLLTHNRPQEVWGDQPAAEDLLGVKEEAEALAETLLLRQVKPPISVAILGGWGSGKSTVMRLMMRRMTKARISRIRKGWPDELGKEDAEEEDPRLSTRVGHIYQIWFNAWTYAKSNLWASLMQTIFWELNRQLTVEHALFDYEKERGTNGRSPLAAADEFQFLYDEYGWLQPKIWNNLLPDKRAVLQPESDKNILWQQLRAKQQKVLSDLQAKETDIARLKAWRQQAETERKKEIIQQLGQESQNVAYLFLRRKSRVLLGDLYQQTAEQVAQNSQVALAQQLQDALINIANQARALLQSFPAIEEESVQEALEQLGGLDQGFSENINGLDDGELGDYVTDLRARLAEAESSAGRAEQVAWSADPPLPVQISAALTAVKQQAHTARHSTGYVESAEEMFANMRSMATMAKQVRTAAGNHKGAAGVIGIIGLLFLLVPIVFIVNKPYLFDTMVARLAGLASVALSAATILGPPLKVAGDWSRRVGSLAAEYQEELETERRRHQALVESNLVAALAVDEQALQEQLKKGTADGQQPSIGKLFQEVDPDNLAAIDYQINQLQLEAAELRREAGPPGEYESLLDFVQARQDEQFYERRLGLMHQVERDINILTGGLVIQPRDDLEVRKAKRELFPRGPARVVLYIDDLDRCPPGRVVEVLEAVQLLLNTELFVVVLGLDTRYITRALEKEYTDILQPDGDPSGLDYIEKILQIPYRVRPIGKNGMARFLQAQMRVVSDEEPEQQSENEGAGGTGQPAATEGEGPGQPEGSSSEIQPQPPAEHEVSGVAEAMSGTVSVTSSADVPSGDVGPMTPVQIPGGEEPEGEPQVESGGDEGGLDEVPPEVIRFQPEDLADLTTCCQLLKLTPRNVKRMVNVLKLIDVFWFRTGSDLRGRQVKSTVMGLLALSAAYPEIMREVLDKIDVSYRNIETTRNEVIGDFLDVARLPSNRRWREQFEVLIERFQSDVAALYDPKKPEQSLIGVTLENLEEDTFNLVRSFSFVGDPTYLSGDDDGSKSWTDNTQLAEKKIAREKQRLARLKPAQRRL